MRFALLLLWLTVLAPAAHATDWLAWRRVGEATLTWGPFTVYHSQLRTPNGRYDGPQQDRALIITYQRDIDREALVDATRDQWQAQGILQQEPRSEAWLRMLQGLWPDVAPGSQLAFVVRGGDTLTLHERFVYDDGEKQQRVWRIRRTGDNRYQGTAGDIEGVASGQAAGNAFHWRYSMNVEASGSRWLLHFDDWMYLQDGSHLFNKTEMKKFGITVATVTLFFTRTTAEERTAP